MKNDFRTKGVEKVMATISTRIRFEALKREID